jgi:DnaJ-class molecular chaperone
MAFVTIPYHESEKCKFCNGTGQNPLKFGYRISLNYCPKCNGTGFNFNSYGVTKKK